MEPLTKHDTILWINHAIAYFKSIGKTQKDMAKILGLEESRVSEMKVGSGTISPNLMDKIIEYCGSPKRNPGHYVEVELYDGLDDFFDKFKDVTLNRFHRKLLKLATNEEIYHHLLSLIGAPNLHYKIDKKIIESQLNEMFLSEEHLDKWKKYSEFIRLNHKCFDDSKEVKLLRNELFQCQLEDKPLWTPGSRDGFMTLDIGGVKMGTLDVFKLLFLYYKLIELNADFKFGNLTTPNIQPEVHIEPVILTGQRILTMKSHSLESAQITSGIYELFGKNKDLFQLSSQNKLGLKPEQYMPDYWSCARCELYLSENMNYYILIQLSHKPIMEWAYEDDDSLSENKWFGSIEPDDRVIICNINSLRLYECIEEIRKWFGLPSDSLLEVKQKIAKAGGYVPGAKVLL
jgi:hypothetical protein